MLCELLSGAGFVIARQTILPDERALIAAELRRICDGGLADIILTTGGTGFSPRDVTPEATLDVAERNVPGIVETMRRAGSAVTKRAMLSRAVSVIRGRTLIVNLPGSPKAVAENFGFIAEEIKHGLDILGEHDGECAIAVAEGAQT